MFDKDNIAASPCGASSKSPQHSKKAAVAWQALSKLAETSTDKSPHKAKNLGLSPENETLLQKLSHRRARAIWREHELPYGCWHTPTRTILHNRFYQPLYEVEGDGEPRPANRREWVPDIVEKRWFYYDGTPEHCKAASGLAALQAWGIAIELPEKLRWRDYVKKPTFNGPPHRCATHAEPAI